MSAPAILFALFAWWFSTGAILYMDRLPPRTHPTSGLALTLLSGVAFAGLIWSAWTPTVFGVYTAFVCALVVWGWHELTFLFGWLTGPRKTPCPEGISEWKRFGLATRVVIHHELALAATAALVFGLTWSGPNQVGTWTFVVLWLMRISAKLNIYLGVRNLTEEFIPHHLEYMKSYFRRRRQLNPLMPLSLAASLGMVWLLVRSSHGLGAHAPAQVGTALVATLLSLAALEHAFLVLPVPDALLWRWAMKAAERRAPSTPRAGQQAKPSQA